MAADPNQPGPGSQPGEVRNLASTGGGTEWLVPSVLALILLMLGGGVLLVRRRRAQLTVEE